MQGTLVKNRGGPGGTKCITRGGLGGCEVGMWMCVGQQRRGGQVEERGEGQVFESWNIVPSPGGSRTCVFLAFYCVLSQDRPPPPEAQNSQSGGSGWSWWGEWVAGQRSGVVGGGWV